MRHDFYKTLGVDRKSDEKTVKAAYRKLARKYHPDVNPGDASAEAKFKEISEAYEVLSDPEKRKLYDRYGENWEHAGQVSENIHFDFGKSGFGSFFEEIFRPSAYGHGAEGYRSRGIEPQDVNVNVEINLEEIDTGTSRTLSYQVLDACKSCDGTGQVRVKSKGECIVCRGAGVTQGMFGSGQPCHACNGTGISTLEKCPTCKGKGGLNTNRRVEVKVPLGINDGRKLRVPGRGSIGANGRSGDLYVTVHEVVHPVFRRKGDDLETDVLVDLTTAVLGGEIRVPTLRGSVTMRIPECSQPDQRFRLSNQGLAKMKGGRGDLFVRLKLKMPNTLSERERQLFRQLADQGVNA